MLKFLILVVVAISGSFANLHSLKYVRPCHFSDLKCIRDNLAANSLCKTKVAGAIPGQYVMKKFRFEAPYFNATYIDEYVIVRNHDKCYVSEFFFNTESDTAVLAVDCPNLDIEANRTLFQHYSLKEDTKYSFNIRGVYPLVRLTTNLNHADKLDICSAFTFADVTALPIFKVNPNDLHSLKYVRPCHFRDLKCIRDNLAANSLCKTKVAGAIPGQYVMKKFRFEAPYFNATYIDEYVIVRNHDKCYVSEFFFNTESDTAVLAVDCPNLDIEANRTLFQHYSLKEDTKYSFNIRGVYPLVRLTTNLNHADKLDICSAFTFADVTALPIFKVNPNDKPTGKFLSKDLSYLNIYERENFLYRAPHLFRLFINSFICNFGCN